MNFSNPMQTDANAHRTTGAGFFPSSGFSRARFLCLISAFCFLLSAFTASAANVRTYFINTFTGDRDTNYVVATKISSNILSSGGVIAQGIPTRLTMTNGASTNFFASGFYSLRNLSLGSGVVINVTDNGSQLYDYTNLLYSGFNTYATVYGSNLPPTYDNVTNALGFLPLTPTQTTNAILQASNALQATIDAIDTGGGTNGGTSGALTNADTRGWTNNSSAGLWLNAFGKLVNGNDNIATGVGAHAEGVTTIASGDYAHAEGNTTVAAGAASHADGVLGAVTANWAYLWNGDNANPATNATQGRFQVKAPGGILLEGVVTGDGSGLTNLSGVGSGSGTFDYTVLTNKPQSILNVQTNNAQSLTNLPGSSVVGGVNISSNLYGAGIPALVVNTQGLTTVKFETNSVNFGNAARSNANIHIKDGALWMPSAGWGAAGSFSGNGYSGIIGWGNVPGVGNNTPPADNSGASPWAKLSAFWYWGGADVFPSGNPWAILTAPNVRIEEGSAGVIPYNGTVELGNEDFFGKVEINYTPTANQVGEDLNVMGLSHPLQFRAKFNVSGTPGWSAPAIQSRATPTGAGYGPGGDPLTMGELEFMTYPRIPNGAYSTNAWTTYPGRVVGTMRTNGWDFRGRLLQEQQRPSFLDTNIVVDFYAGYAQTITLAGSGTNVVTITNVQGFTTNYEARVVRLLTGGLTNNFIWPSNWTVLSEGGSNVLPSQVSTGRVIHLKLESWDTGASNITVQCRIGLDTAFAYDTDAASAFTRGSIADPVQKGAVDYLAKRLKANNLWTNIVAIYPFVGGASNSHAVNLKSTSFPITFTAAGVTHNTNGITGNGSSGSGNTGIDPRTVLGAAGRSNVHLYVYSRTQARTGFQRDFSTTTTSGSTLRLGISQDGTSFVPDGPNNADTSSFDNLAGDFRGMLGFSRPNVDANSWFTVTRSAITARSTASTGIPTGKNLILLARSFEGFADDSYSSANLAIASVGWGYTSNELFLVRNIVDNYQSILGRKTP